MNKIKNARKKEKSLKKKPQNSRAENTIIEWKNSIGSFKSRFFESKRISDLEDRTFEIIQSVGQRKKKTEERLWDLQYTQ